jgi:hypothetical protein
MLVRLTEHAVETQIMFVSASMDGVVLIVVCSGGSGLCRDGCILTLFIAVAPPPEPPPQCPTLTNYKSCVSHRYCGWCGDILHGTCKEGNIEGPVYGACIEWNYHQNPELGMFMLAIPPPR